MSFPQTSDNCGSSRAQSTISLQDAAQLNLASPALETMLNRVRGVVITSPTPNAPGTRRQVTRAQADFARGFEDALKMVRMTQGKGRKVSSSQVASSTTAVRGATPIDSAGSSTPVTAPLTPPASSGTRADAIVPLTAAQVSSRDASSAILSSCPLTVTATVQTLAGISAEDVKLPPATSAPDEALSMSLPSGVFVPDEILAKFQFPESQQMFSEPTTTAAVAPDNAPVSSAASGFPLTTTASLPGGLVTSSQASPSTIASLMANLQDHQDLVPDSTCAELPEERREPRPRRLTTRAGNKHQLDNVEDQEEADLLRGLRGKRVKREFDTDSCSTGSPAAEVMRDSEGREISKRERNRLAARKCREGKLKRLEELQRTVTELKAENAKMDAALDSLRDQVYRKKKEVIEHKRGGCIFTCMLDEP